MIRCNRCNHQNVPGHRFCGMCGESLAVVGSDRTDPTFSSSSPATPPASVSGPSFLGLAEPTSASYLLDDEPRRGHWLLYLGLVLVLATAAMFAWRWRTEGYAWRVLMASRRLLGSEDNRTAANGSMPVTSDQKTAEPNPSSSTSKTNDGGQLTLQDRLADAGAANLAPPETRTPEEPKAKPVPPPKTEPTPVSDVKPSPALRGNRLVAEGESYLYGRGVPKNCARARTSLFMAADEEDNPDAQSILGTMFATGHCVTVDLPTAYHWLSRAQRQERANPYVISNLRIVWKEMTAEQQEAARRSSQ